MISPIGTLKHKHVAKATATLQNGFIFKSQFQCPLYLFTVEVKGFL